MPRSDASTSIERMLNPEVKPSSVAAPYANSPTSAITCAIGYSRCSEATAATGDTRSRGCTGVCAGALTRSSLSLSRAPAARGGRGGAVMRAPTITPIASIAP